MPRKARAYISCVSAAGVLAVARAILDAPRAHDPLRYGTYLALSLLAAGLKVKLPGLSGTMSIGFLFVVLGIFELTLAETMVMACAGVMVQCYWRARQRPSGVQVVFGIAAVAVSLTVAYDCAQFLEARWSPNVIDGLMVVVTCVYFVSNSLLVSGVLALEKGQPFRGVWQKCYLYACPYYFGGGVVAGLMMALSREAGWQAALMLLPIMAGLFLLYRIWLGRMEIYDR